MNKLGRSVIAALLFAGALALAGCGKDDTTTTSGTPGVFNPGTGGGGGGGGGGGTTTAAAGSIQFVSATPNAIGVTGSGQATTAVVIFQVSDATGTPLSGAAVSFNMAGPGGGTYIGPPNDGTPNTATGTTTTSGNVSVILNSGTVAGPVTITATVTGLGATFSASSSVLSIGGAVPSANHFSLATGRLNLPGLVLVGFPTTLTAFVADRFSNSNVLAGTRVSFFTEAGAVDAGTSLDASGIGSVTFRTQSPAPVPVVVPPAVIQQNGHVTVIAVVRGEEGFVDVNANGVYDVGEPFTDDGEPYIDANDNNIYDAGEQFVDTNGNGLRDGPNGVWDGPGCPPQPPGPACNPSPNIWSKIRLQFTGNISVCDLTPSPFTITRGQSQTFSFTVGDANLNKPVPGTTITFTPTGGTLVGQTSFTVVDAVSFSPFTGFVTMSTTPTTTLGPASITMKVSAPASEVVSCNDTLVNGTIQ